MDALERRIERQALNATLETYYHEIRKNQNTIESMKNSVLPERLGVIQDAEDRIAQLDDRVKELLNQRERFRHHEDEYAD